MQVAADHYLAEFRRVQGALPGAALPWLANRRERAIERFAGLGFPSVREEDWKYTNVAPWQRKAFSASPPSASLSEQDLNELRLPQVEHLLVFVNGRFVAAQSRTGILARGVLVESLARTVADRLDVLGSGMGAESVARPFAALNEAFFSDGAVIRVPAEAKVESPIHLLFIATTPDAAQHVRNFIDIGRGGEATVIEHYVGACEGAYFTNTVTEVRADENATLRHYKLQQESVKAFHVGALTAKLARASVWHTYSFSVGGALARNDIATIFDGEGAQAVVNGLYMVDGRQHVDHHTRIDHAVPRCVSREFYKGIVDGASRAVFNGKVVVHRDAQHTDAEQSNKNLLLSEHAEVDTKPEFEIYADNVKCAHGATVGQLDANQLFYLRTRGIDAASARTLLTFGFAEDVISGVTFKPLRDRLEQILIGRLPESERLKELL
jgi:Fe-S cluster assembly protein SufD